ncbi:hypothetical protein KY290_025943 [Solanum tuberosum]|uniref:Uncharacterized protein n=1 Tax=Solanum tuberosum TaxID=4113 RepID=A0ABQ7UV28_SOLTU|nr:hypothetical protein KY289_025020 [Solanum tuberosum]KAH0673672.1 hypothetical protein KY284_024759 [Solanum tuberosum]KAH0677005.1 hypothetical protein KY285_024806 [Solanum tuberosum]KAH0755673.1 hypothetical protein KY290_025943 [Solanum tuberosum]
MAAVPVALPIFHLWPLPPPPPQTLSLQEFNTYSAAKQSQTVAAVETKGLIPEEVLRLRTDPRERTAEELDQSRLVGGFRSCSYYRQGGRGSSDDSRR